MAIAGDTGANLALADSTSECGSSFVSDSLLVPFDGLVSCLQS